MSSRFRRISATERGFTLIEQVVVMSLLLIVVSAMLTIFSGIQRTTARQIGRSEATDDVRLVMQRLTKEARQLTTVRAGSGPSVLDMDTFINGAARRITYTASGSTLTRAVNGGATKVVLERLPNTSLFTFSPDVAAPSDIAITLSVRSQHYASDGALASLTSEIQLRNRG